jgi:hypothetical protein
MTRGSIHAGSRTRRRSPTGSRIPVAGCASLKWQATGPISWTEYHRARMPFKDEAELLQIPVTLRS